jgi:hypothetical protein
MINCICVVKSEGFNSHRFVRDILYNKVDKENLIFVENFVNTQFGYFIHNDKCYQMYTNVIKDNINYIAVIEY